MRLTSRFISCLVFALLSHDHGNERVNNSNFAFFLPTIKHNFIEELTIPHFMFYKLKFFNKMNHTFLFTFLLFTFLLFVLLYSVIWLDRPYELPCKSTFRAEPKSFKGLLAKPK